MTAEPLTSAPAKAGGVLVATSLATLVVNANTSAVSILLPSISEDVGTSVDTLQWAVTGYSLVGRGRDRDLGVARRRVRPQEGVPRRPVPLHRVVRAARAVQQRCGSHRRADDPGSRRRDAARLRPEPAVGGQQRPGAAAGGVDLGWGLGGRRGGRPVDRRSAGGHHRLAGAVLARRRHRRGVRLHRAGHHHRVARPEPAALHRHRRHAADRRGAGAARAGAQRGRRLGLGVGRFLGCMAISIVGGFAFVASSAASRRRCWTSACCATRSWWPRPW